MCLIECNQPVYPLDIVRTMRDQRAMMIQTPVSTIFHILMCVLSMMAFIISVYSKSYCYHLNSLPGANNPSTGVNKLLFMSQSDNSK